MDTDKAWDQWGTRDPYYGVLAVPKFRAAAITPEAKEEFFATGRQEVQHVLAMCERCIGAAFAPRRVLDFGCGVGRMVIPFASVGEEVIGMDVAPSMLAEAKKNCVDLGLTNVSFVGSDDGLSAVKGRFNLVHSNIVLQHIEVARGRVLFAALVDRVAPGGCGAIQVTYGWTAYSESFGFAPPPAPMQQSTKMSWVKAKMTRLVDVLKPAGQWSDGSMGAEDSDPEMQMNFYNLSELMFILRNAGVTQVLSELTDHGGALGTYIFFHKKAF